MRGNVLSRVLQTCSNFFTWPRSGKGGSNRWSLKCASGGMFYVLSTKLPPASEVWGKVIFLHLFVILFTGGACVVALGGRACVVAPGGHAWLLQGGMRGCCRGGVHGCSGGACGVAAGGACMGYGEIRRYGQWAGSTHPTGMHSCVRNTPCTNFSKIWLKRLY